MTGRLTYVSVRKALPMFSKYIHLIRTKNLHYVYRRKSQKKKTCALSFSFSGCLIVFGDPTCRSCTDLVTHMAKRFSLQSAKLNLNKMPLPTQILRLWITPPGASSPAGTRRWRRSSPGKKSLRRPARRWAGRGTSPAAASCTRRR